MYFITVGSGMITEVKEQAFPLSCQMQVTAERAHWSQAIKNN